MLLNIDKVYYLNTYSPGHPTATIQHTRPYLSNRNFNDQDYWLIQFSCDLSFKVYPFGLLVPEEVIDKIRNRQVFLILDNAYEYFYKVVESVYVDIVQQFNIPPEQIILSSGNYDLAHRVKQYAEQTNQQELKVEYFNYYELSTFNHYMHHRQKFIPTLQKTEYSKKFLCLNRRWRVHRTLLLTLLYNKNLIDQGHISFKHGEDNQSWQEMRNSMHHYYRQHHETLKIIDQCFLGIKEILPLNLDDVYLKPDQEYEMMLNPTMDHYYVDTYFSVVTETTHDRELEGRFITEKTFKPIALRHPFIMIGPARMLEALRELGYRTFDGIIDESYDQEPNEVKRIEMAVNEIERLSNLSGDELQNFIIRARDICFYNYVNFRNRDITKFEYVRKMN